MPFSLRALLRCTFVPIAVAYRASCHVIAPSCPASGPAHITYLDTPAAPAAPAGAAPTTTAAPAPAAALPPPPTSVSGVSISLAPSLAALLASADVLFIALPAPLPRHLRHVIDAAALAGMKPDAIIVNVAAGSAVEERAVADALEHGKLAGACVCACCVAVVRECAKCAKCVKCACAN
jgi:hypothetical protein